MLKESRMNGKRIPKEKSLTSDYIYAMNLAPKIDESTHWFQMLPIAFFVAVIIMITKMAAYERPMDQFFWSGGQNQIMDFFSYYKMIAIIICSVIVLVLLLYRVFAQSFSIKKSYAYIPMIVYTALVLLSYLFSSYKEFSLLGYNDRFEGTLPILGYMILLFYIINSIRTEKDVKWVIYPIAVTSALLGLLGLSQALGHDFFRTDFGKMLITPSWFWNQLDSLNFTFKNNEIYQTVYNINYVSFYLTLLIPLFGMLFILSITKGKEEPIWKKLIWGALFTLLIYNLIGSASAGGLFGMAVVVFVGLIVLNKRLIMWWKPVLILLCLSLAVAGISYERWLPELTNAMHAATAADPILSADETSTDPGVHHKIDYLLTTKDSIILSIEENVITFKTDFNDPLNITATDSKGKSLDFEMTEQMPTCKIDDARFKSLLIRPAQDETGNKNYYIITTDGNEWPFLLTAGGPRFINGFGKEVEIKKVPAIGWKDNQGFGSGRGYIWSRTIPMMKDTLIIGHGADTFCLYYPQYDYAGKYSSPNYRLNKDIIIDKPHNMYFDAGIGTGVLSLLALLVLWGIYIVQSFRVYTRRSFDSFITFIGAGIFFGICGFLASGLVNDSSVSVMPLFYGLLGTGISINLLLSNQPIKE